MAVWVAGVFPDFYADDAEFVLFLLGVAEGTESVGTESVGVCVADSLSDFVSAQCRDWDEFESVFGGV